MKTLLALAALILTTAVSAQAGLVSGYTRSNGTYVSGYYRSDSGSLGSYSKPSRDYTYQNPYAAYPSVSVRGYSRKDGTIVLPYNRTPANNTELDNLSYRGFGTVRIPRGTFGR